MKNYKNVAIVVLLGALVWQGMAEVSAQESAQAVSADQAAVSTESRTCVYQYLSGKFELEAGFEVVGYSAVAEVRTSMTQGTSSTTRHYALICELP